MKASGYPEAFSVVIIWLIDAFLFYENPKNKSMTSGEETCEIVGNGVLMNKNEIQTFNEQLKEPKNRKFF